MATPTQKFAAAIQAMTYTELDELALWFTTVASDDNGDQNDPRYNATALIDHCDNIERATQ